MKGIHPRRSIVMNDKLNRINQVGIIVTDREKAIAQFEKYFGIDNWKLTNFEDLPIPVEFEGKVQKMPLHVAIADMGNGFEIEVIQPMGECSYMTWLKEHGPGVHHFAAILPNQNAGFKELRDEMLADGGKIWTHAHMVGLPEGEGMDFTYMDMRESMGSIIEMYNEKKD